MVAMNECPPKVPAEATYGREKGLHGERHCPTDLSVRAIVGRRVGAGGGHTDISVRAIVDGGAAR